MREWDREVFMDCRTGTLAVFGAGKGGRFIAEMVTDMGCAVSFFMDNDIRKQETRMGGVPVISPERYKEFGRQTWVLLSVRNREIERQLLELGVESGHMVDLSELSTGGRKLPFFDENRKTALRKKEYRFLTKKDRETLHTGISRIRLCEGFLYVTGWAVPSGYANKITVTLDGEGEKTALRVERRDVAGKFPYVQTQRCGFAYFGKTNVRDKAVIGISFWSDNRLLYHTSECRESVSAYGLFHEYFREGRAGELLKIFLGSKDMLWQEKDTLEKMIRNNITKFERGKDRLCLYQLLYHLEVFKAADMEEYLCLIRDLDDLDVQAYLCEQEIPWMIFLHPEWKVDHIYAWQREMYCLIAEKMYTEKGKEKERDNNRIVILVDALGSENMASAIFEIGIANEMYRRGIQVLMVVADTSLTKDLSISSCFVRKRDSGQYAKQHKKMQEAPWGIYYCVEEGFRRRKQELYDVIEEFSPDTVIDVSLAGMFVSAALLRRKYKLIHVSLTGYSSGAVFHRYIAKSRELCRMDNRIYHSIREEEIVEAPILILYGLESRKRYTRAEQGIGASDFVLVTVGNRLKYELDGELLCGIKELLCRYDHMKWIVVGEDIGETFRNGMKEYIEKGQVVLWGFEDDLPALYRLCDIYVNPERMGGGGSVFMAMQMEMPVAMTKKPSDITPVIGAENCRDDYQDMMSYIVQLMHSVELRKKEGGKMKKMVEREEISMANYVSKILMAREEISTKEMTVKSERNGRGLPVGTEAAGGTDD